MEDENIKNAKQATEMAMLQERARKYQEKLTELSNKVYKGKRQGISIDMKGNYDVVDLKIDQSFYETSSKSQMEQAILVCLINLKRNIEQDQEVIKDELNNDIMKMQSDALKDKENGTDKDNN